MNRKTWMGVLVILLALAAAGAAPQALELSRALAGRLPHGARELDGWRGWLASSLALGLGAFLLAVRGVLVLREGRGPRGGVLAQARRGRPLRDIARELGLPHDAVRLALRPELCAERERP